MGCALGNSLGTVFPGCTLGFSTVCPILALEERGELAGKVGLEEQGELTD